MDKILNILGAEKPFNNDGDLTAFNRYKRIYGGNSNVKN